MSIQMTSVFVCGERERKRGIESSWRTYMNEIKIRAVREN